MLRMLRKESGRCFRAEKGVLKKKRKKHGRKQECGLTFWFFWFLDIYFFFFLIKCKTADQKFLLPIVSDIIVSL